MRVFLIVISLLFAVEHCGAGVAGETPKRGGTLNIHHSGGGATQFGRASGGNAIAAVHLVAPFYSVLMRVRPTSIHIRLFLRFDCDALHRDPHLNR